PAPTYTYHLSLHDALPISIPEDHRKAPINPYGKSKLVFEGILADYQAYTGLQYASLRYFNAAGASKERGEHHRVETHLIPRVLEDRKSTRLNSSHQIISYA